MTNELSEATGRRLLELHILNTMPTRIEGVVEPPISWQRLGSAGCIGVIVAVMMICFFLGLHLGN